jgi:hypothetical protein
VLLAVFVCLTGVAHASTGGISTVFILMFVSLNLKYSSLIVDVDEMRDANNDLFILI